jgi:hypothetical protein
VRLAKDEHSQAIEAAVLVVWADPWHEATCVEGGIVNLHYQLSI